MHTTLMMGRGPNDQPRPVRTDGVGNLVTTPAVAGGDAVRLVDVAGDSCMDEANNAARVSIVAGAAGGGPATIANGADVAEGATTDAPASSTDAETTTARTGVSLWKGVKNVLLLIKTALGGGLPAALGTGGGLKVDGSGTPIPVTGTFYPATQPVSIASMPSTPVTGTFYPATQPVSGDFYPATQPVSGDFYPATQPVSGAFYPVTQPVSVVAPATTLVAAEYTSDQSDAQVIATPGANKRLRLYDIVVSAGAAGTVLLESAGTTRLFGRLSLAANGGWSFNSSVGCPLTTNEALTITTTCGAGPVAISVCYTTEDV